MINYDLKKMLHNTCINHTQTIQIYNYYSKRFWFHCSHNISKSTHHSTKHILRILSWVIVLKIHHIIESCKSILHHCLSNFHGTSHTCEVFALLTNKVFNFILRRNLMASIALMSIRCRPRTIRLALMTLSTQHLFL